MADQTLQAFPYLAAVTDATLGEAPDGFVKVQDFLERFGYLEGDGVAAGSLDEQTSEALGRFQRFFGLEETGTFDDETRQAMMQPRCAMPDPAGDPLAFATTCAWNRRNLTFAFDTGTNDVAGTAEFDAIRRAFASWQALGRLTFTEVGTGDNPDIRIGWRPAADPDRSMVGGVLAHADFPPGCSVVTNTLPKPVHFDDSEHVWSIGAVANAFDIETVALHELGHILGLAHSSVAGAVMAPTVSSNFTKRALTQDDIDGLAQLYPVVQAWSNWASQGGVLTSNIAVARNKDGRLEAFVRGTDGAVWNKWQTSPNGPWSGWNSLGGFITSDIGVGRNADGRLEIFARGSDNAMWHKWQVSPGGGWSAWNSQGGVLTSPVAVGSNKDGRLEAFVRGTDGALWHKWQASPGGGWSAWNSQGGVLTSEIAIGTNHDGRLEAFVRGTDNALWHKWQVTPNGGWSAWNSQGGVLTSNIAVASNQDGRLEAFVRGTDNAMWHKWQATPGGGWSAWNSQGGVLTSDIAVGRNQTGRLEAFVRGTNNGLWHKWQASPGGGWSAWNSQGGVLTSRITVASNQDGRLEVFVRGTDNAMWHKWQNQPFLTAEIVEQYEGAAALAGGNGVAAEGDMPSGAMAATADAMPTGQMAANGGAMAAAEAGGEMPTGSMAGEAAGDGEMPKPTMGAEPGPASRPKTAAKRPRRGDAPRRKSTA